MRESDWKKLFGLEMVETGSMLGVMTLAVYTIFQSISKCLSATNRFNSFLNDYFNGFQHRSLANTTNFNFANEFEDIENNENQFAVDLDVRNLKPEELNGHVLTVEANHEKLFGLEMVETGSMLGVMTLAVYTILQSIFKMSACHTLIASTHFSTTTSMVSNIVLWPTQPTPTLPTNSKTNNENQFAVDLDVRNLKPEELNVNLNLNRNVSLKNDGNSNRPLFALLDSSRSLDFGCENLIEKSCLVWKWSKPDQWFFSDEVSRGQRKNDR
ncbi:unnamed protein product [Caenorhabditis angaria]|uniref:Uncharacterized protein n=1 Tax=Caenorhabditis angaria TaxID=860376 RepID=A0A9P1IL76_9PELO|nr:unnamed protein product [Caenorhabditis angaria]